MTALKALAILESAVLECKKRDINTPEVKKNALDLLEPYIWPKWVVPQFRDNVENEREPWRTERGNSRYFAQHSPVSATQFESFSVSEWML